MRTSIEPTRIPEVLLVRVEPFQDERGFFFESYNRRHWAELGFDVSFVQENHSGSQAGVVRGLHFQDMAAPMGKLVRCLRGAIFDVAVDLRLGSPTFGSWVGETLTAGNRLQLYCPVGFAHGFAALEEGTEVLYKCTGHYAPAAERAVRWNDPDLAIAWPVDDPVLSERDRRAPGFAEYLSDPAFRYR
jgi:dTDP-4-dehydrorhamnose 3,5-epimerase